jgi:hypothetical protein
MIHDYSLSWLGTGTIILGLVNYNYVITNNSRNYNLI